MKLYDFFMLLENLEAFRTAKGVPLACQKFIRIDHGQTWDLSKNLHDRIFLAKILHTKSA